MPSRPRERYITFLVAPAAKRASRTPVFAVRVSSAAEALSAVARELEAGDLPVIVGSLSTRTTKAMKLKPGEMRLV